MRRGRNGISAIQGGGPRGWQDAGSGQTEFGADSLTLPPGAGPVGPLRVLFKESGPSSVCLLQARFMFSEDIDFIQDEVAAMLLRPSPSRMELCERPHSLRD